MSEIIDAPNSSVQTGGGAGIGNDVHVSGDFSGRDSVRANGDHITGNKIEITGYENSIIIKYAFVSIVIVAIISIVSLAFTNISLESRQMPILESGILSPTPTKTQVPSLNYRTNFTQTYPNGLLDLVTTTIAASINTPAAATSVVTSMSKATTKSPISVQLPANVDITGTVYSSTITHSNSLSVPLELSKSSKVGIHRILTRADQSNNFLGYEIEAYNNDSVDIRIDNVQIYFTGAKSRSCLVNSPVNQTYFVGFYIQENFTDMSKVITSIVSSNVSGVVRNQDETGYRVDGTWNRMGTCLLEEWSFELNIPVDVPLLSQSKTKFTILFNTQSNKKPEPDSYFFELSIESLLGLSGDIGRFSLKLENGEIVGSDFDGQLYDLLSVAALEDTSNVP